MSNQFPPFPGQQAQPFQPQAPVQQAPVQPQQAQQFQPQFQQPQPQPAQQFAGAVPDVSAMMAGATAGSDQFPLLTSGNYMLEIESTEMGRSGTLKAVCFVRESDNESFAQGMRIHLLFPLGGGKATQIEARRGAAKRFLITTAGYQSEQEADPHMPALYQALNAPPGPLVGRLVRVQVTDNGRRTKDTNEVIYNFSWSVV